MTTYRERLKAGVHDADKKEKTEAKEATDKKNQSEKTSKSNS